MKPKKKNKKEKKLKKSIRIPLRSFVFLGILFIGIGFALLAKQPHPTTPVKQNKLHPTPTPTLIPLPTINPLLQGTFKTYTNDLYQFSVTYPALGENENGNLITCGSNIQQATFVTHDTDGNTIVVPQITIDSFYTITAYPWGGELQDYINHFEPNSQENTSYVYTLLPHVDESVFFQKPSSPSSYFGHTLTLLKKGNLIFKVDTTTGKGCQMLFDPRDYNQNALKPLTSLSESLLFSQYRNWNESTSISFTGSALKNPTE